MQNKICASTFSIDEENLCVIESDIDGTEKTITYAQVVAGLAKSGSAIVNDLGPASAEALHMAIGISGEVAELLEAVMKNDQQNIIEELGDFEFYFEGACQAASIDVPCRDYTDAFENYQLPFLVIAAGNVLDAAKRIAIYGDDSKWPVFQLSLKAIRVEIDKFYSVNRDVSRKLAVIANLNKLVTGPKARYKSGSFTNEQAIARADKDMPTSD